MDNGKFGKNKWYSRKKGNRTLMSRRNGNRKIIQWWYRYAVETCLLPTVLFFIAEFSSRPIFRCQFFGCCFFNCPFFTYPFYCQLFKVHGVLSGVNVGVLQTPDNSPSRTIHSGRATASVSQPATLPSALDADTMETWYLHRIHVTNTSHMLVPNCHFRENCTLFLLLTVAVRSYMSMLLWILWQVCISVAGHV